MGRGLRPSRCARGLRLAGTARPTGGGIKGKGIRDQLRLAGTVRPTGGGIRGKGIRARPPLCALCGLCVRFNHGRRRDRALRPSRTLREENARDRGEKRGGGDPPRVPRRAFRGNAPTLAKRFDERRAAREPRRGILGKGAEKHGVHGLGTPRNGRGRLALDRRHHHDRVPRLEHGGEGRRAGEKLVEDAREGVLVRAAVLLASQPLLRRHVGPCSGGVALLGRHARHRRADFRREAEIEKPHADFRNHGTLGRHGTLRLGRRPRRFFFRVGRSARLARAERLDHDVGGLDVTMDDPLGMGVIERGGHLATDLEREIEGHDTVRELPAPLRERDARRVVHDHHAVAGRELELGTGGVVPDVDLPDEMDHERLRDVRMRESVHEPELLPQQVHLLGVALEERVQGFDGHLDAAHGVPREVHHAEPAAAELAQQVVVVDAADRGRVASVHRALGGQGDGRVIGKDGDVGHGGIRGGSVGRAAHRGRRGRAAGPGRQGRAGGRAARSRRDGRGRPAHARPGARRACPR